MDQAMEFDLTLRDSTDEEVQSHNSAVLAPQEVAFDLASGTGCGHSTA